MPQVVEEHFQTEAEAKESAEEFRNIDGVPAEVVKQDDGTFVVRATYPDDVQVPGASPAPAPAAGAPAQQPAGGVAAAGPQGGAVGGAGMTIGPKGAALVKSSEGCERAVAGGFQAYRDSVGVLTIGWGHTNDNGTQFDANTVWSQAQCDAEFLSDMSIFEKAVKDLVKVPLNQNQFDALVSFTFNLGKGNLATSTLLKKLNAGNYAGAAQEFPRWNKAGGQVLAGLTKRRAAEAQLFQTPV